MLTISLNNASISGHLLSIMYLYFILIVMWDMMSFSLAATTFSLLGGFPKTNVPHSVNEFTYSVWDSVGSVFLNDESKN